MTTTPRLRRLDMNTESDGKAKLPSPLIPNKDAYVEEEAVNGRRLY